MNLRKLFCRHSRVRIFRCHPMTPFGQQIKDKSLFTDRFGVLNVVQCRTCQTFLKGEQTETVYESEGTDLAADIEAAWESYEALREKLARHEAT